MPALRQTSSTATPSSAWCRMNAICCSLNRERFIARSPRLPNGQTYREILIYNGPVFREQVNRLDVCPVASQAAIRDAARGPQFPTARGSKVGVQAHPYQPPPEIAWLEERVYNTSHLSGTSLKLA